MTGVFVECPVAKGDSRAGAWRGWVEDGSGCHVWVGSRQGAYGSLSIGGKTRNKSAHVWRYENEVGPVPPGLELDHFRCNNKLCCNPAHVRPVTHRENMLRGPGVSSENLAKTHCPSGHPYSGYNLIVHPRTGNRYCRECRRKVQREYASHKRAADREQEGRQRWERRAKRI